MCYPQASKYLLDIGHIECFLCFLLGLTVSRSDQTDIAAGRCSDSMKHKEINIGSCDYNCLPSFVSWIAVDGVRVSESPTACFTAKPAAW